jgi:Na+/H+-dicarboxylate symporter
MVESLGGRLHIKILTGLLLGATLGILANTLAGGRHPLAEWVNHYAAVPLGQIFLRMLFMIVIPLVFASITLGVASLGDLRRVGRIGGKAVAYFLATTFLAAATGLFFVGALRPGDASARLASASGGGFGVHTFVNIVTRNPAKSAVEGDMPGVIFFGQVFGIDLNLGQMAVIVVMAVITAVGAAGVPGASIPLLAGIVAMLGVPGEGIAIILGVDRLLDMSRTAVNVYGDISVAAFLAREEGLRSASMAKGTREAALAPERA